jgi:hypothetical protein
MELPPEIFADIESLPSLDSIPSIDGDPIEAINSGNFDIFDFIPDEKVSQVPPSTFYNPPPVSPAPEKPQPVQQTSPGPTPEDQDRLNGLEEMLASLDDQIKSLSVDLEKDSSVSKQKNEELMDQMLMSNVDEKSNPIQVATPFKDINTFPGSETVINKTTFNKEKLKEIEQQKETLLKERETILKSFTENFSSKETNNNNIVNNQTENFDSINNIDNKSSNQNFTDLNKVDNSFSNTTNQDFNDLNSSVTNNQFNESIVSAGTDSIKPNEIPATDFNLNSAPEMMPVANETNENIINNSTAETNNPTDVFNTSNNMFENINNSFTESVEQQMPGVEPPVVNIDNNLEGLGQEQNFDDVFASPGNTPNETLPPSQDNNTESVQNITGILTGIKEGINKLNDSLGSNFSNLNQSIQGIKTNVVNNNSNYNGGTKGGSKNVNNNTQQRPTMTEYRGDFPQKSDFPKGFDVTLLGGTNLSNPEQIA